MDALVTILVPDPHSQPATHLTVYDHTSLRTESVARTCGLRRNNHTRTAQCRHCSVNGILALVVFGGNGSRYQAEVQARSAWPQLLSSLALRVGVGYPTLFPPRTTRNCGSDAHPPPRSRFLDRLRGSRTSVPPRKASGSQVDPPVRRGRVRR